MTESEKDIEKKISNIISELDKLDTAAIEQSDKSIVGYNSILSKIGTNPEVAIGTEIGQWKIIELLGQGGMSIIYLVERTDKQLSQQAALKIIPNAIASQSMIDRFVRERQILSDLNHNNIAKLYDAGVTENDIPWFVMELVQGDDILSFADKNDLNAEQRIILFRQVCDALSYAHSHGVIHRDIKPSNLMINEDKVVKLLDFGIASTDEQQKLTMTGAVIGTPGYMSPEQAKGMTQLLDRRTDIFSLGVLLYKLLKNEMPFQAASISEISFRIINDEPTLMGNEVSADLQAIAFKCLEKKRSQRYQSVKQLNKDITAYLNGDAISARKITFFGRQGKKIKKHPLISSIITVAILATIFGIGNGVYQTLETFKRVKIAEKHLSRAQEIKAKVRRTHMMPFHNVRDKYQSILSEIEVLEKDIESSGSDTTGLSSFALGIAFLAMDKKDRAYEYFKLAKNKGWESPELSSGLGLTLTYKWTNARVYARTIENETEKKAYIQKQRKMLYEPAINHLKIASSGLSTSNYVAAYLQYLERDYEKAIESIEKEIQFNPWHFEAFRLANTIYTQKYYHLLRNQSHNQSKHYLTKAADALGKALEIGRSAPINYEENCILMASIIQSQSFDSPEKIDDTFNKGLNICNRALTLFSEPQPVTINGSLQQLYRFKANHLINQGKDPTELLEKAIVTLKKLIDQYSNHEMNYVEMVATLKTLTDVKIQRHENPQELYDQALVYIAKVKKINPLYPDSWFEQANIQTSLGNYYVQVNNLLKASDYYYAAIENANKSFDMGIEVENMIIISTALAKLASISVLKNKTNQGITLYKKSLTKFEELFKRVNDDFSYYEKYFSIAFDYFLVVKKSKKQPFDEISKVKQTFNKLCQSDFIKERHHQSLNTSIQKFLNHKLIMEEDIKFCKSIRAL